MNEKLFLTLVKKDGGEDGSSSTPASYIYTLHIPLWRDGKCVAGDFIASGVPVVKPRCIGRTNPGVGLGLAVNIDGRTVLWDAGETPMMGVCSAGETPDECPA